MITSQIFAKKDYVRADGSVPLYLRLTINSKVFPPINLQRRVILAYWDSGLRQVTNGHPNARKINHLLNRTQAKADDILLDHEITGRTVTWETFRKEFAGLSAYNYYDLVADYLEKHKSEFSDSYKDKIRFVTQKLSKFAPSLELHQINYDWLLQYKEWMSGVRSNGKNTIHTNMKILRRILLHGKRKRLIREDPFEDFKFEKIKTERPFLTIQEVHRYLDLLDSSLHHHQRSVLYWFLLAVYTGRRYGDLLNFYNWTFKSDHILIKQSKKVRGRQDSKIITLFMNDRIRSITSEIIEQNYRPIPNARANKILKEINALAGVSKKVTFHGARHTFANINKGLTDDLTVRRDLLGHDSIKSTLIYERSNDVSLKETMQKWNSL